MDKESIAVIICAGENGRSVVFGYVDKLPKIGEVSTIKNARMILRWDSQCGGLFGLATNGPRGDTRITLPVKIVECVPKQWLTVSRMALGKMEKWLSYNS